MEYNFKKTFSDIERKNKCDALLIKCPNCVPVILEKDPNCKIPAIKTTKFLVLKESTINEFIKKIKELIKMSELEAIFLAVKGKYAISGQKTMEEIYENYKDKQDGFLYITYSSELIYG